MPTSLGLILKRALFAPVSKGGGGLSNATEIMPLSLTLGPLLFNWSPDRWRDFYARVADEMPVERVFLGEVVCSKRLPFIEELFVPAVERLTRAGKKVYLASLALPTLTRERRQIEGLLAVPGVGIEVNDLSGVPFLKGRPFAASPLINVYNEGTVAVLKSLGAEHICLPPELPLSSIRALAPRSDGVTLEVFAFGRVPLAISARCYHARIHDLSKDSCQFICGQDPDGLAVDTLDREHFLAVNGVQTLSSTYADLLGDLGALAAAGISSLRLSPHACDMVEVATIFRDAADGACDAAEAQRRLAAELPDAKFSNGFLHGKPGWKLLQAAE
jgi:O2-independent ubiquinone biosynthesis protein UbiV